METPISPKQRGRPRLDAPHLSREHILLAAGNLLGAGANDVNMRAVASALGVNAMALYHYFSDKQALRLALIEQAFAPLLAVRPRLVKLPSPERRLHLLAQTYLRCAAKALPLTRHLAERGAAPLAMVFSELFEEALGNPTGNCIHSVLQDVLVDYLHGVALAGPRHAAKALDAGWPVLMAGVRQHLQQDTAIQGDRDE